EEAALSSTAYYNKHLKEYVESTNDPIHRERQMEQDDLLRICVSPELSDKCRIHILGRAWHLIQQRMIEANVVSTKVFSKSMHSPVFAIRDRYFDYMLETFGDIEKAYKEAKKYSSVLSWFEELALQYKDCPSEIVKEHYSKI
ncbi:unnamed protein product, partial [marine sediment metagenome]